VLAYVVDTDVVRVKHTLLGVAACLEVEVLKRLGLFEEVLVVKWFS